MKIDKFRILGVVGVVVGFVAMAGCGRNSESETTGVGETTGAALDKAAEKTAEAARVAATATKEVTGQVVEKTGEVLEKAGSAVERAGADMQE